LSDESKKEAAEYLRLNVTQIDKEGKFNIYGYGRATKVVSSSDEDPYGRLYYLYADYRDALNEHLDLRAGRTYVTQRQYPDIDGLYIRM